jgi:formylglycine-generating enzyme required for sulfatase activity
MKRGTWRREVVGGALGLLILTGCGGQPPAKEPLGDEPEMVRIKGGCFQMGSPASEEGGPEGSVI